MPAASEGALLSLIVDDEHALHALAAWAAIAPRLDQIGDQAVVDRIVELGGVTADHVRRSLDKLVMARVLVDGGITDLADRLLQSRVQARLAADAAKPRRKR